MPKNNSQTDILFVTHRHKIAGGAEKALIDLIEYLTSLNFKIHVVVGGDGDFITELKRLKVPYTIVFQPYWAHSKQDPSPFHFTSLNPTVNTTLQLVELINKLKPRLCVTNTIVVPWLAYASSLTATPHAWMIHELGTAGLDLRYAIGEEQSLKTINTLSDVLFFNSKYTANYYRPFVSPLTQTEIVYPGGNQPVPEKIPAVYRKSSAIKMVSVAQIKPQKGQFDAVKAVKNLVDSGLDPELLLVGLEEDKEYVKEIRKFIKKYHLENNIKFAGHQSNPASYVEQADIALVTSVNDAFGRVTVEAMLQSKAVIAAASAGSLEIIEDGKTGLHYHPGDDKDLAKKITLLLESPKLIASLGKTAKKTASAAYNEDARYASFVNYVKKIPKKKSALDLSPLSSAFVDFRSTISLFEHTSERLNLIESNKAWKILRKLRNIIKR